MSYIPISVLGLLVGTLLKVFVPYVRAVLENIAKTGKFVISPAFDWRYLAMILLPLMEFGVAFLTVQGLWEAAQGWPLIMSISLAYSGTDLGKEFAKGASALYNITRR